MAVLAGLGGGHLYDLAGTPLHDYVAVLAQRGALDGEGVGGAGLGSFEVIYVCHGASGKGAGGGKQTLRLITTRSFSVFLYFFGSLNTRRNLLAEIRRSFPTRGID